MPSGGGTPCKGRNVPPVCLFAEQVSGRKTQGVIATGGRVVSVHIMRAVGGVITAGIVCGGVIATGGGIKAVDITGAVGGIAITIGRITIQHF